MLRFGVLGPLLVERSGQRVPVPRAGVRRLLALLLVNLGAPIRSDALIAQLWPDRPTTDVRRTLHVHLSQLRQVLGGADRVASHTGSYAIRIDQHTFDAWVFEQQLSDAEKLILSDPAVAGVILRDALRLWRGPAYEDLRDLPAIATEADRLDELRLNAYETTFDLELGAGQHARVVAELAALAAANPYRERIRAQHMLALYRCGRQTEALDAYRQAYQRLTGEIGVEPGPDLQYLHRAILADDPALRSPSTMRHAMNGEPAPAGSGHDHAYRVDQLPPSTPYFTGRADVLDGIAHALGADGPALVTLTGIGGVGKTTTAVRAARDAAEVFADGCLFADLRGTDDVPLAPEIALGYLLRSLGVPAGAVPDDGDDRLGLYRSMTSARRLLIVFDNAVDVAQVRPLLPTGPGCAAIVTSRRTLAALDGTHRRLAPLESDHSHQLLRTIVGPDHVVGGTAVDELVRLCGGIPLALRVVGARLVGDAATGAEALAAQLARTTSRLDELRVGDLDVGASLTLSYRRLPPEPAALLRRIGSVALPEYSEWHCRILLDADPTPAISTLVGSNLLNEVPGRRYGLHDLVRLAALATAVEVDSPRERSAALTRIATANLQTVHRAVERLKIGRTQPYLHGDFDAPCPIAFADRDAARSWLAAECDNLLALVRELARYRADEYVWQLAAQMQLYLFTVYRLDEWYAIEALVEDTVRRIDDLRVRAAVAHARGLARQYQVRYPEALACYESALTLARQSGDDRLVAHMGTYVGRILRVLDRAGDLEQAAELLNHALTVDAYTADESNVAYIRVELGALAFHQNRFRDSMREFALAIETGERLHDDPLLRLCHHSMANVCLTDANDRPDPLSPESRDLRRDAEHHARIAIALASEANFPAHEARSWEQLGYVLMYENRRDEGLRAFDRALKILDALQDVRAVTLRRLIADDDWTLTTPTP